VIEAEVPRGTSLDVAKLAKAMYCETFGKAEWLSSGIIRCQSAENQVKFKAETVQEAWAIGRPLMVLVHKVSIELEEVGDSPI